MLCDGARMVAHRISMFACYIHALKMSNLLSEPPLTQALENGKWELSGNLDVSNFH